MASRTSKWAICKTPSEYESPSSARWETQTQRLFWTLPGAPRRASRASREQLPPWGRRIPVRPACLLLGAMRDLTGRPTPRQQGQTKLLQLLTTKSDQIEPSPLPSSVRHQQGLHRQLAPAPGQRMGLRSRRSIRFCTDSCRTAAPLWTWQS